MGGGSLLSRLFGDVGELSSKYDCRRVCETRGDVGGSTGGGGGGALVAWATTSAGFDVSDSSLGRSESSSSDTDPSLGDLIADADGGGGGGRAL
jgi:hypothetical protein